ncbi:MAG: transcription termination factor NusA [Candidatus Aminicenantia bacterium]
MPRKLLSTIEQLSRERGVEPVVIIKAIEEALVIASSKYFGKDEKINAVFNPEKDELKVFVIKKVVEKPKDLSSEISLDKAKKIDPKAKIGMYVEIKLSSETLGRIAAQAAKQVLFQKVRDAEQEIIFSEFSSRAGEIINGIVRRFENGNVILDINKAEAILPSREQPQNEVYQRGDRVKAIIVRVLREAKGPQIVVSRTDPSFLVKLLELEVPEVSDGIVEIKGVARQPGERAKVAVYTKEKDVDPIGACIGMKGNRILSITKELKGERIDVIEWVDNPLTFVKSALSPAKITKVSILDEREKILEVIVPQDQLSLAIGKKGYNVRLASKLIGWKLEIKTDIEKREEVASTMKLTNK